jgi:hypothetical protein
MQGRKGVLSHLSKSFEERRAERDHKEQVKALEKAMKEEKLQEAQREKERRLEKQKRKMENEYKNSIYQEINPSKIKGMSKKQLRSVKKTSVNRKTGKIELVNPWSGLPSDYVPPKKK